MSHQTGRAFISLNGQRIRSKEGATLNTGGIQRQAAVSDAGVDGFTESVVPPQVQCKINHNAQLSLKDIHAFKDGTLVFETDTGKVFTLVGAWSATPPAMSKGEVDLTFEAMECLEG